MLISVCVPTHEIPEREAFMKRLEASLAAQTFQDFELVVTDEGKMAENTNAAIKKAKGDIIKLLYMDDFLYSPDALQHIADEFKGGWAASGCVHTEDGKKFSNAHFPSWNDDMAIGKNTVGSPSVVAFENNEPLLFDESLSFMLDCELYVRLYERYGEPQILPYLDVAMGLGDHQMTNIMPLEEKYKEAQYVVNKHRL
jgi:hypothetical protein